MFKAIGYLILNEYWEQFWSSHLNKDTTELKGIQRRVMMVRDMEQYPYGSYTTKLGPTVLLKNDWERNAIKSYKNSNGIELLSREIAILYFSYNWG